MSEYKGTLEQSDLDWIDGVVNDANQLDNMLSVGRAQRILNTIAELEALLIDYKNAECRELKVHTKLYLKHTALVDGIKQVAESTFHDTEAVTCRKLNALLGKESEMSETSVDLHSFLKQKVDGCIFHDHAENTFCIECEPYYLLLKMVDGLRELAEKWRTEDTSYYGEGHAAASDIEALLGKEKDDG